MADALAAGGALAPDRVPSGLRVNLLGPMQVECDGQLLHVAGPQRRRLLAMLACRTGRVVSVEALVDAMWGDDPPPSAAKTVQSHVARLRSSIATAGDPIETGSGGYRLLLEPDAIDVNRFEALADEGAAELALGHVAAATRLLEAADALWRGPALMEFTGLDFAGGDSTRLEERRSAAQEDLAAARLRGHGAAAVVGDMERAVAASPGRERSWALLMHALYACGRQQEALSAYQRARTALADEFGLEPGPELRDLERRIIEQDPSLLPVRRATAPAALRADAPIVGRRDELAWLTSAWRRAEAGFGQVRSVLGPVGSGRTRLIAELATGILDEGADVEYVLGANGLHQLAGDRGPGAVVDVVADRCRDTPLLVVVDDVQWTPQPSIDAIRALASAVEGLGVFLVLVGSDGEGPGIDLVRELERSTAGTLRLSPMPADEITEILVRDGADADAISAVVGLADGLPGSARREAAAWAERAAAERLGALALTSLDARSVASDAEGSVVDEVMRLVETRSRRAELSTADWAGRQPYRALASYEPADADLFVGRERLVAELAARVLDRRLVAVVGASGSGKSSIVRAGLLPLVRSGRLPGTGGWHADVIVPGADPIAAIDAATARDHPGPHLLVIDQFEEVQAKGEIEAVASRLLDLLFDPALDMRLVIVIRADQLGAIAASRSMAEVIEDAQLLVGPPTSEELRRIVLEPARRTGCAVEPDLVSMVLADVAGHDAALPLVSAAMAEVWSQRDGDTLRASTYLEIGGLAAAVERLGDRALAAVAPGGHTQLREIMLRLVDVADDGAWVRRRVGVGELPDDSTKALDALVDARLVTVADGSADVVHEIVFRAWPQMVGWLEEARADLVRDRDLRASARTWAAQGRSDDDVLRGARLDAAIDWSTRAEHVPPLVTELIVASRECADRDEQAIREQLARERRGGRRLRTALAIAAALLLVATAGIVLAVRNSRNAVRERDRADAAASEAGAAAERADQAAGEAAAAAEVAEQRRVDADELRVAADRERSDAQLARMVAASQSKLDRDLSLSMLLAAEAYEAADTPATRGALLSVLTRNVSSVRAAPRSCCFPSDVRHVNSSFAGMIAGPPRIVDSIAISDDGSVIATAGTSEDGAEGAVFLFDTDRRELTLDVRTTSRHPVVALAADGSRVLILDDGGLRMHTIDGGTTAEVDLGGLGRNTAVNAFFTADGDHFVVASKFLDGAEPGQPGEPQRVSLHLFDTATLDLLDVELPDSPLGVAGIMPDGTLGIGEATAAVSWDIPSNSLVRRFALAPPGEDEPSSFRASSDMRWLAGVESNYGQFVIWDLATGAIVGDSGSRSRPQTARTIAFDPAEPSILAVGSADGSVTMYDVAAGGPIGEPLRGQAGGARAITFSADGRLLATTNDDGTIGLWTDNGEPSLLSTPLPGEHWFFDASADGDVIVVGDRAHVEVRHANVDTPVVIATAPLDPTIMKWWDVSDDGSRLLGGVLPQSGPQSWTVYDSETGAARWSLESNAPSYWPGLSPDGSLVGSAVGERERLRIWDIEADTEVGTYAVDDAFPDQRAFISGPPAFSADGSNVFVATSHGFMMIDTVTGEIEGVAAPFGGLQGPVRLVEDDGVVVGSGQRGGVWRWDIARGEVASGDSNDPSSLFGAVATSDGSLIASPHGFTSSVALFDGDTLKPIGDPIPTGDVGEWARIALSSDGTRLITNDAFNHATEWNLDVDTWPAIACHAAGRNLTRAEFAEYLGADTLYRATCEGWPPAGD